MTTYHIVNHRDGTFTVESASEVLGQFHSLLAAQQALDALNYEPGNNPFDHFANGRWSEKGKP